MSDSVMHHGEELRTDGRRWLGLAPPLRETQLQQAAAQGRVVVDDVVAKGTLERRCMVYAGPDGDRIPAFSSGAACSYRHKMTHGTGIEMAEVLSSRVATKLLVNGSIASLGGSMPSRWVLRERSADRD